MKISYLRRPTLTLSRLRLSCLLLVAVLCCAAQLTAQVSRNKQSSAIPVDIQLRIIRAEDQRRWDTDLQTLLKDQRPAVRSRATLAAGRIGDERAIEQLADILLTDNADDVRTMAAFALGEIESSAGNGAESLISILEKNDQPPALRARAVEALGKITAALPKSDETRSRRFSEEILKVLQQASSDSAPDRNVTLLAITATLRARPANAAPVVAKFLNSQDARVRADAENTLARLRAKESTDRLRELLVKDSDAVVRANATRALGIAEDKSAFDALVASALHDADSRARVSAVRALATINNRAATSSLLARGEELQSAYQQAKHRGMNHPEQINEILEIATTLGKLNSGNGDEHVVGWLKRIRKDESAMAPEVETALARVAPVLYLEDLTREELAREEAAHSTNAAAFLLPPADRGALRSIIPSPAAAQGLAELASSLPDNSAGLAETRRKVIDLLEHSLAKPGIIDGQLVTSVSASVLPDAMRAYAAFKPQNLNLVLAGHLSNPDVIVRATSAELLGDLPSGDELARALPRALSDTENDAALAILDALGKQKTPGAIEAIKSALNSKDHLVRRRAVAILKENGAGDFSSRIGTVQTRNTDADYRRAITRIGRLVRATVKTEKGSFTIRLLPDDAPLTVDNFVQLAKRGYFNGITFHRVVPNFVVQGGDPRGDGNGGPGYQIRCEINEVPYDRGAVGMALSGKDTGGSQWFVTHSPQPHLDGGYTVFGQVIDGMPVVDRLARGDKILSVSITEGPLTASNLSTERARPRG
jgi:cyclophilin family peptidyl-prolyl cis-trans isomerase/HEAT repeat protein